MIYRLDELWREENEHDGGTGGRKNMEKSGKGWESG